MNNSLSATNTYISTGMYEVVFSVYNDDYPEGYSVSNTITVLPGTFCVAQDSATPKYPYTSWETAATTINDAISATKKCEALILVSNGTYSGTSSKCISSSPYNGYFASASFDICTLRLETNITLQSVNGPEVTIISAGTATNGKAGVKMSKGAKLIGFTVENAHSYNLSADEWYGHGILSHNSYSSSGGGIWAEDSIVENCIVKNNKGGGIHYGTVFNSAIISNAGSGAESAKLFNCTVAYNATLSGGAVRYGTVNNCIVWGNTSSSNPASANYYNTEINHTCTTPLPSGEGNISVDPLLVDGWHLSSNSPCIGAGLLNSCSGLDIDGEVWQDPPALGCDQPGGHAPADSLYVSLSLHALARVGVSQTINPYIVGDVDAGVFSFGDGAVTSGVTSASHTWTETGTYEVVFTAYNTDYPDGISATQTVRVVDYTATHYVSLDSPAPQAPYSSWETAAHTIQEALDAVEMPYALVRVNDGCYNVGGRVPEGYALTNRVYLSGSVTLRSENGPEATIIEGAADPVSGCLGFSAIRGVFMEKETRLIGFTVTNGCTMKAETGDWLYDSSGGGVWCEDETCIISNCVITGNHTVYNGGGVFRGTLYGCELLGNESYYGGGGAYDSVLYRCSLEDNSVYYHGGGSYGCELNNCLLRGNDACDVGGGAFDSDLNNCTLTENSATNGGGGVHYSRVKNCIIWNNTSLLDPSYRGNHYGGSSFNYCCTEPLLNNGTGNISTDPCLIDSCHIATTSPCVAAGSVEYCSDTDIDGEAWLSPPSIGCDEPVEASVRVVIEASAKTVTAGIPVVFTAQVGGSVFSNRWDYMPGGRVALNALAITNACMVPGVHSVVFTVYNEEFPTGLSFTRSITVLPGTFYAWTNSPSPQYPYTSWETAAHGIQAAVNAAGGCEATVYVRDGVYNSGYVQELAIDLSYRQEDIYKYYRLKIDRPI
ncbi:MAG: hypothetical protein PHG65_12625, partial [Kiritimatiellae bacterium]|nr:hypothetical protein [Kiritimatiellia bacterium]